MFSGTVFALKDIFPQSVTYEYDLGIHGTITPERATRSSIWGNISVHGEDRRRIWVEPGLWVCANHGHDTIQNKNMKLWAESQAERKWSPEDKT